MPATRSPEQRPKAPPGAVAAHRAVIILGHGGAPCVPHSPCGIVRGGQAPDVRAIPGPTQGVLDAVGLLGQSGPVRVFEVGAAFGIHVSVSNMAEVNPAVGVFMAE